jgi:DNA-directed RNA polymerase subunit delta
MIKKRVIVDYKNVPDEVLQALAEKYPHGYAKAIITFNNAKNEKVNAVPIELDDTAYLVKVSTQLQKMVDDFDVDDIDALVIESGKPFDGVDDEFGVDENDEEFKYDNSDDDEDDLEDSLEDHLDEAENIADDSDY